MTLLQYVNLIERSHRHIRDDVLTTKDWLFNVIDTIGWTKFRLIKSFKNLEFEAKLQGIYTHKKEFQIHIHLKWQWRFDAKCIIFHSPRSTLQSVFGRQQYWRARCCKVDLIVFVLKGFTMFVYTRHQYQLSRVKT